MIRGMNMQDPWLEEVIAGRKTVEGRTGEMSKYESMVGDRVLFYNSARSVIKKVVAIRHYNTLDEYLAAEWENAAPQTNSLADAKNVYLSIYDERVAPPRQVFADLPNGITALILE
jgi:ASC-1-like (ASCH) protein